MTNYEHMKAKPCSTEDWNLFSQDGWQLVCVYVNAEGVEVSVLKRAIPHPTSPIERMYRAIDAALTALNDLEPAQAVAQARAILNEVKDL